MMRTWNVAGSLILATATATLGQGRGAPIEEPVEVRATDTLEKLSGELKSIYSRELKALNDRVQAQARRFQRDQKALAAPDMATATDETVLQFLELLTYRLCEISTAIMRAEELEDRVDDLVRQISESIEDIKSDFDRQIKLNDARRLDSVRKGQEALRRLQTDEKLLEELRVANATGRPLPPDARRAYNRAKHEWAAHDRSARRYGAQMEHLERQQGKFPAAQEKVAAIRQRTIDAVDALTACKIDLTTSANLLREKVEMTRKGMDVQRLVKQLDDVRIEANDITKEVSALGAAIDSFQGVDFEQLGGPAEGAEVAPTEGGAQSEEDRRFMEMLLGSRPSGSQPERTDPPASGGAR
jgi:hypothetical protein